MKTRIYYFTGTGNSLKVSKDIASELGDTELISIPRLNDKGIIECDSNNTGIVFPVYMLGMPLIVVDFIKRLKVKDGAYLFVVANHGTIPGPGGTVLQARNLMKAQGIKLSSIFTVKMINNYTPMFRMPSERRREEIFHKAKEKAKIIAGIIKDRKTQKPGNFFVDILLSAPFAINKALAPIASKEDKEFWVDDKCDSCGVCKKACPVNNIRLSGGRPTWLHNCQQCISCFSLCPRQAIQLGRRSQNAVRYKNPEITVKEIMDSRNIER